MNQSRYAPSKLDPPQRQSDANPVIREQTRELGDAVSLLRINTEAVMPTQPVKWLFATLQQRDSATAVGTLASDVESRIDDLIYKELESESFRTAICKYFHQVQSQQRDDLDDHCRQLSGMMDIKGVRSSASRNKELYELRQDMRKLRDMHIQQNIAADVVLWMHRKYMWCDRAKHLVQFHGQKSLDEDDI